MLRQIFSNLNPAPTALAGASREQISAKADASSSGVGALTSLSLSMLLSSLGISSANVALPTLAHEFTASFQAVQWVVLAYLLAVTTLIVSAGRLGDVMGRRRLLLFGIFLFTSASLLCASAPSLWLLIGARCVQGLGAALMMSLSLAFVAASVPKARIGSAMGTLGTMSAIGTALGPSLGGALISYVGWRAIFFLKVPLGLLAWLCTQRFLAPDVRLATTARVHFDSRGTVLLALTLAAYALATTLGRGHFGAVNLILLCSAVLGLGLFLWAETRATAPLIQLATFYRGGVIPGAASVLGVSLGMNGVVSSVMMATLVVGPFYLSRALGLDAAHVGIVMSLGPVVAALSGVPAGRLVDRLGAPRMTLLGLAGVGVGCLLLSAQGSVGPGGLALRCYLFASAVSTASYALFQAANNTAVMGNIAAEERGLISGLLSLSRNLGLITGASAMGSLFALASGASDVTQASPSAAAGGMRVTFAVGATLALAALAVAVLAAGVRRRAQDSSC